VSRTRRVAVSLILTAIGIALLIWQVRKVGTADIQRGFTEVGWGFLVILALSLARFVLRSAAWMTVADERTSLVTVTAATIGGDAIGNLTPFSLAVSEPSKALYLRDELPLGRSLAALTAENVFYSLSVALFIVLGTGTMLTRVGLPQDVREYGLISLGLMIAVLAGGLWIVWRNPPAVSAILHRLSWLRLGGLVDRVRRFEETTYAFVRQSPGRLAVVIACQTAFHALSVLESYWTLWLLTGTWSLLDAFILDTFSRIVAVVARPVPLKAGVDEVSTAMVATAVGLTPAIGVTLALIRKARILVWAALGMLLMARKGLGRGNG
jgi:hypothetical protein